MDIRTFCEVCALFIVIVRLITLRKRELRNRRFIAFCYWVGIICSCGFVVRLIDGRVQANIVHLAILITIACFIWFRAFIN